MFDFIDTIQVLKAPSSRNGPQVNDLILSIGSRTLTSRDQVASYSGTHEVTYLRRPFGRSNALKTEDRGLLFLEHVTVAIKVAAAAAEEFDSIVYSNSKGIRIRIHKMSQRLRNAAKKQCIRDVLEKLEEEIRTKKFMFDTDKFVVQKLTTMLLKQFCDNWNDESEKQHLMSKRLRDILLTWGCFSKKYMVKSKILHDQDIPITMVEVLSWFA
jgi:hypothetical protein